MIITLPVLQVAIKRNIKIFKQFHTATSAWQTTARFSGAAAATGVWRAAFFAQPQTSFHRNRDNLGIGSWPSSVARWTSQTAPGTAPHIPRRPLHSHSAQSRPDTRCWCAERAALLLDMSPRRTFPTEAAWSASWSILVTRKSTPWTINFRKQPSNKIEKNIALGKVVARVVRMSMGGAHWSNPQMRGWAKRRRSTLGPHCGRICSGDRLPPQPNWTGNTSNRALAPSCLYINLKTWKIFFLTHRYHTWTRVAW